MTIPLSDINANQISTDQYRERLANLVHKAVKKHGGSRRSLCQHLGYPRANKTLGNWVQKGMRTHVRRNSAGLLVALANYAFGGPPVNTYDSVQFYLVTGQMRSVESDLRYIREAVDAITQWIITKGQAA